MGSEWDNQRHAPRLGGLNSKNLAVAVAMASYDMCDGDSAMMDGGGERREKRGRNITSNLGLKLEGRRKVDIQGVRRQPRGFRGDRDDT